MADYKYLEDGTPVTAEELNSRFTELLGDTQGVNEVTPDMLAFTGMSLMTLLPRHPRGKSTHTRF